jgi:hypothetical protein
MQHCIKFGANTAGGAINRYRLDVDLTNISLEYPAADGIYMLKWAHDVTIHGAQAGPAVVDANMVDSGGIPHLGANGGLGGTIDVGGGGGGAYDLWEAVPTAYPGIHHTGRQGIATDWEIFNLTIRDISIWRPGRTAIDIEMAGTNARCWGLTIARVEFGHWFIGCISSGAKGSLEDFVLEDCICYKQFRVDTHSDEVTPDRGVNWTIRRNRQKFRTNTTAGPIYFMDRTDGLTITDNFGPVQTVGQGIDTDGSTDVTVSPTEDSQCVPISVTTCCGAPAGVATAAGTALTPTIAR